jgi:polysaccharide export outer membrane protein
VKEERHLRISVIALTLAACPLAACGSLPSSGPSSNAIVVKADADTNARSPYDVVEINPSVADVVSAYEPTGLARSFGKGKYAPDIRIGVGDTVEVTIFEAASGGLFSSESTSGNASKNVTLPAQTVDSTGAITVPYAGRIPVKGRTPSQVGRAIDDALAGKAIKPQAVVSVTNAMSTSVTVTGDVAASKQVTLSPKGDRVLDAIAAAGGPRYPAYETFVSLTRNGKTQTMLLAKLIEEPRQNVYLRPNDQVFVFRQPQTFTAFGATGTNTTVPFDAPTLNLAEAVGKAGGLSDMRADAGGVYVFRYETAELAKRLGLEKGKSAPAGTLVPVVYHANLKNPQGYFAAQRFMLRDKDIVYVSNAPATDLGKFLTLIGLGTGTVRTSASTVSAVN